MHARDERTRLLIVILRGANALVASVNDVVMDPADADDFAFTLGGLRDEETTELGKHRVELRHRTSMVPQHLSRPWLALTAMLFALQVVFALVAAALRKFAKPDFIALANEHPWLTAVALVGVLGIATGIVGALMAPKRERIPATLLALLMFAAVIESALVHHRLDPQLLMATAVFSATSVVTALAIAAVRRWQQRFASGSHDGELELSRNDRDPRD